MAEEGLVGHEPRHGDDAPAGRRLEDVAQALEVGDAPGGDAEPFSISGRERLPEIRFDEWITLEIEPEPEACEPVTARMSREELFALARGLGVRNCTRLTDTMLRSTLERRLAA